MADPKWEVQPGSPDDPVIAVWFRTRRGEMISFDLVNGQDVDRVMSMLAPISTAEPFRFSQVFDFIIESLTFIWVLKLVWAMVGILVVGILNIIGWLLYQLFHSISRSPIGLLRGIRRITVGVKWVFWRRFVSVRIGKKWQKKIAKRLAEERAALPVKRRVRIRPVDEVVF